MKKYLPAIIIAIVILLLYFVVPKPIEFSATLSLVVMILLGLALTVVLIMTIMGRMIERRIVFIFIGVSLTMPFFMSITLPIKVTNEVRILYDALDRLPPGSKVVTAFDYDPPSAPELQPMAETFMKYALKKDLKLIIMGLWPQGPQQAQQAIENALKDPAIKEKNIQYGTDYVNLGFQTGNEFVIQGMGTSFRGKFPSDIYDTPYDSIPLLRGVENFSNIDFVMNFSAGKPGTVEWVQVAVDRFGANLGAGNTAVQAPQVYPYLNSGQLTGLLGGMSGGAEFEKITNEVGDATTYMLSQSFAHVVIIIFIIIGNVALFLSGNKPKKLGA